MREKSPGLRVPSRFVIDPGHGGSVANGGSTPFGVRGPLGTFQKDLTWSLACHLRRELAARNLSPELTRSGDENPSLEQRARRAFGAAALVSLHLNSARDARVRGSEIWLHEGASASSERLGRAVQGALPGALLRRGPLSLLDPAADPEPAGCLVELDYLSNPDVERSLIGGAGEQLARSLADGIT